MVFKRCRLDTGLFWGLYVSFIGLRLTKTSLTLITRLRTKGKSPVTLKSKLESLSIISSVGCYGRSKDSFAGLFNLFYYIFLVKVPVFFIVN